MKYYIDYENVNSIGLDGVELLDENNEVNIYFSGKAATMKLEYVDKLLLSKAKINLVEIKAGTANALDFQMIVNIYCEVKEDESFVIISKDKGYDAAISAGIKKGIVNADRAESIKAYLKSKDQKKKIKKKDKAVDTAIDSKEEAVTETQMNEEVIITETQVCETPVEVLEEKMEVSPEDEQWVCEIVMNKTGQQAEKEDVKLILQALEKAKGKKAKNQFYQFFVSKFGAKGGLDYYNIVKPAYEDLKHAYRSKHKEGK